MIAPVIASVPSAIADDTGFEAASPEIAAPMEVAPPAERGANLLRCTPENWYCDAPSRWFGAEAIRARVAHTVSGAGLRDADGRAIAVNAPARLAIPTPDGDTEVDGAWRSAGDAFCFVSNDALRPTVLCASEAGVHGRLSGAGGEYRVRSEGNQAVIQRTATAAEANESEPELPEPMAAAMSAAYSDDPHFPPCGEDTRIDIEVVWTAGGAAEAGAGGTTVDAQRSRELLAQQIIVESNVFLENSGVDVEFFLVRARLETGLSALGPNGGDVLSMKDIWECAQNPTQFLCVPYPTGYVGLESSASVIRAVTHGGSGWIPWSATNPEAIGASTSATNRLVPRANTTGRPISAAARMSW